MPNTNPLRRMFRDTTRMRTSHDSRFFQTVRTVLLFVFSIVLLSRVNAIIDKPCGSNVHNHDDDDAVDWRILWLMSNVRNEAYCVAFLVLGKQPNCDKHTHTHTIYSETHKVMSNNGCNDHASMYTKDIHFVTNWMHSYGCGIFAKTYLSAIPHSISPYMKGVSNFNIESWSVGASTK